MKEGRDLTFWRNLWIAFGFLFLAMGATSAVQSLYFWSSSVETQVTVLDVEVTGRARDISFRPVFEATDLEGVSRRYRANISLGTCPHEVGDVVPGRISSSGRILSDLVFERYRSLAALLLCFGIFLTRRVVLYPVVFGPTAYYLGRLYAAVR